MRKKRAWFHDRNAPRKLVSFTNRLGESVTKRVNTRLVEHSLPDEPTFVNLTDSTFMKPAEDDLQDVASSAEIHAAADIDKIVRPNQLPKVVAGQQIVDEAALTPLTVTAQQETSWISYVVRLSSSFWSFLTPRLLRAGGTSGQVLKKLSNADYDVVWANDQQGNAVGIPVGGTTSQVLAKVSGADYDVAWQTVDMSIPTWQTYSSGLGVGNLVAYVRLRFWDQRKTIDYDVAIQPTSTPSTIPGSTTANSGTITFVPSFAVTARNQHHTARLENAEASSRSAYVVLRFTASNTMTVQLTTNDEGGYIDYLGGGVRFGGSLHF
jgi:hypothetical protein